MSATEYRAEAKKVCIDAEKATEAVEQPTRSTPEAIVDYLERLLAGQRAARPQRFEKLDPPEDLAEPHDEIAEGQPRRRASEVRGVIDELEGGERPARGAPVRRPTRLRELGDALQRRRRAPRRARVRPVARAARSSLQAMGFMDKAKKLADQARPSWTRSRSSSTRARAARLEPGLAGPAPVEYDQHGRPVAKPADARAHRRRRRSRATRSASARAAARRRPTRRRTSAEQPRRPAHRRATRCADSSPSPPSRRSRRRAAGMTSGDPLAG